MVSDEKVQIIDTEENKDMLGAWVNTFHGSQ